MHNKVKLKNLFIFTFIWINEPTDNCTHVSKKIQTGISTVCTSYHLVSLFLLFVTSPFSQSVSSVAQLCLALCNPMNCSTPGLPVHHQLPEFTQIHIHSVGDAIQPSHPLSSPLPPTPNPSQHQSFLTSQLFA